MWAFGSISTTASMGIRCWLYNSSSIESNDWVYISATAIAQFYRMFIKGFGHFMLFWEMTVD